MVSIAKEWIEPMLCTPQKEMYLGKFDDRWIAEVKYDGERIIAERMMGRITLWTRRRKEVSHRFPEIVESLKFCMPAIEWVIDGELIVDGGFEKLLKRNRDDPASIKLLSKKMPATYHVFDVLSLGETPIMEQPLSDRREYLMNMLNSDGRIRRARYVKGSNAKRLFDAITANDGEGVVLKHLDSIYLPGKRASQWMKIKKCETVDVEIIGATVSERFPFGSLVMAKDGQYYGKVGTGFTERMREDFLKKLRAHPDTEDFSRWNVPADVKATLLRVCSPLRAEVKILETHSTGSPRHPVWVRWRE